MRASALVLCVLLLAVLLPLGAPGVGAAPTYNVSGHVVSEEGRPLSGIEITAQYATNGTTASAGTTDDNGYFSLSLSSGTYNISATSASYQANMSYNNVAVDRELTGLDFTMSAITGLKGHVTNGTTPVIGAKVVLFNPDNSYPAYSAAPNGWYIIKDVKPGNYLAYAEKSGLGITVSVPVTIINGTVTELNFDLSEQPTVLQGKVTFGGNPLSGVDVTITFADGHKKATSTNSLGLYLFEGIPSGEYTVTFSKGGYIGESYKVTLEPMKSNELNVQMDKDMLPGNSGFLAGYDLAHSLMVIGLVLALITLLIALFMRVKIKKNPTLADKEDEEKKD